MFQQCAHLTSLELLHCLGPVSDACTELQARHPAFRLRHLVLAWCGGCLSDVGISHLLSPDVSSLRSLVLEGISRMTDIGLREIAAHRDWLECLELASCGSWERLNKGGACATGTRLPEPISAAALGGLVRQCRRLVALTVRRTVAGEQGGHMPLPDR